MEILYKYMKCGQTLCYISNAPIKCTIWLNLQCIQKIKCYNCRYCGRKVFWDCLAWRGPLMTPLPGNYLICAHPPILSNTKIDLQCCLSFSTLLNYWVGEISLFPHLDNLTILSHMPDNRVIWVRHIVHHYARKKHLAIWIIGHLFSNVHSLSHFHFTFCSTKML